MDVHTVTFGERLRQFRLRAGLSQTALAELANLSPGAVTALERGARGSPYPHTLGLLSEALRLSREERALLAAAARSSRRRVDAPVGTSPRAPSNLPNRLTKLIGREHDIQRVRALILGSGNAAPGRRLITLTGVGGVGKTSLAMAVADQLRDSFDDGVWLVELAPLADAALVPRIAGAALGVPDLAESPPEEALVAYLRTRHVLLVLDNCEHVIDACVQLGQRLLDNCQGVHLLATSREPLLLPEERQIRVQPLPSPDEQPVSVERVAANPAVQLFVTSARAADPNFTLTPETVLSVAGVCSRLEGIPLAIELAAARLTVLTPQQLLDRLGEAFRVLGTNSRVAPTRQQTLRATLDWSYNLLTPPEQAVFRRLGVFASGCHLEAAEAICAGDEVEPEDVLGLIARLVDKSLVIVASVAGAARYRLLEPLRQYALQCLVAQDEASPVEQRFCAHYLGLAERAAPQLSGPDEINWLSQLDRELDNLRAVVHRAAEGTETLVELRLVNALRPYWEARGLLGEGRGWLEHAIARARRELVPTRLLRDALFGAGRLAQWQADLTSSAAMILESVDLSRALGDDEALAEQLAWLGTVYRRQGDEAKALVFLDQSLAVGRNHPKTSAYATALTCKGALLGNQGDTAPARDLLEMALELFRALGDLHWQAIALVMLGETALAQHDVTRASGWLAEALVLLHAIGDPVFTLFAIEDLADAEIRAGRPTRAARWLGATEVLRDRLGAPRALPNVQDWQRMIEAIRSQLGGYGLERALAAGRGLSLEQILAEAVPSPTPRLAQPRHEPINDAGGLLTRREQEVARLLVQGLSDREIGVRLSITVGTASLHVHRILAKLKIRSRWQIAAGLAEGGALNDDDRLATPAKGCV